MTPSETSALLAPLALDRARMLAPWVLAVMCSSLLLSETSGVPLAPWVLAWNMVTIPVFALGTLALLRRRVPVRYGHLAIVLMWWGPLAGTLASKISNHSDLLVLILIVELASAAILLHTPSVLISFVVINALWVPLCVRDSGDAMFFHILTALTAEMFALLLHLLIRRSLVQSEVLLRAEALSSRKLAEQVAELERSEAERARLHDQLLHAQRMEATGTLAAGLAHDMNNVLASITTYAELVHRELHDPRLRADLEQVTAQAARGAELTRGLLAFSRRGAYRKRLLQVDGVIREVEPLLTRTLPKSIEIRVAPGAPLAWVEGDDVQLAQALVNFGLNAADAMNGHGILEITSQVVELEAAAAAPLGLAAGSYVRISVRDNGAGMDEATRRRVFEPFFTTKPAGRGTGLGLSTVWGVVQSHGGAVEVASRPGHGATFSVHLPVVAAPVIVDVAPLASRRGASIGASVGPEPSSRATVLVVDDEPAVRSGTARLLERHGLHVLTADNGAEALRVFAEHGPAVGLVILDMGMPVMGGAECFRRLREHSSVPVLVTTGYAVDEEVQELVARGAALLEKPVPSADLRREVMRLLDAEN